MRPRTRRRIRELDRIAQEQAALRHVAILIAHGAPPAAVFDAVTKEIGRLLDVRYSVLCRYEPGEAGDMTIRVLSSWRAGDDLDVTVTVGSQWELPGSVSELVLRTGRPARTTYESATSGIAAWSRARGIRSAVGSPIIVAGRLWGLSVILSTSPAPLPADAETRMAQFVELAAVAIESAESRDELIASRARTIEATDTARRRIERDLHDGVQQHLISLGIDLQLAERAVPDAYPDLKKQVARIGQSVTDINDEVREIARGVYSASLARKGLGAALKGLARRSGVPVVLRIHDDRRLAERLEVTAYYVVSEALTNAAKHAGASGVWIDLAVREPYLRLTVHDDGVGGANPGRGSGLIGLKDRVEALGGRFEVISHMGHGTTLTAEMPLEAHL